MWGRPVSSFLTAISIELEDINRVQVRIARIFNTYGPRMCLDDGRVVSNFVAQALRKEPMTVYGDGKQTRSFQYVSDLVEGLMRLMEGEHVGPFNLGNPGEFTMLELAKVVQDTIDPNAKIEFRPNTEDDPHKRKPDISKAKELLGWQPMVPLREGLPMMVSDFRQRIFGNLKEGGSKFPTVAEDYFKRASIVEPKDAEALKKYASFLWQCQNDLWAAEETYLEAISADPNNSFYAAKYAHFL
ncbi:UDP-glucuronic acid decarboxylase 2-like protein [Tanacetum coccineum]